MKQTERALITLNYALSDVHEIVTNIKNYERFQVWLLHDKYMNLYWALINYNDKCDNFNISVYKHNIGESNFKFSNAVAEVHCSIRPVENKNVWFIDEIFVKETSVQRKGLATRLINIVEMLTYKNQQENELNGLLKVFTSDKTVQNLVSFYRHAGFTVSDINKTEKTAIIRKELSKDYVDNLARNVVDINYNNLNYKVMPAKELKNEIENTYQGGLSK